jgi:hypothetical protein
VNGEREGAMARRNREENLKQALSISSLRGGLRAVASSRSPLILL